MELLDIDEIYAFMASADEEWEWMFVEAWQRLQLVFLNVAGSSIDDPIDYLPAVNDEKIFRCNSCDHFASGEFFNCIDEFICNQHRVLFWVLALEQDVTYIQLTFRYPGDAFIIGSGTNLTISEVFILDQWSLMVDSRVDKEFIASTPFQRVSKLDAFKDHILQFDSLQFLEIFELKYTHLVPSDTEEAISIDAESTLELISLTSAVLHLESLICPCELSISMIVEFNKLVRSLVKLVKEHDSYTNIFTSCT